MTFAAKMAASQTGRPPYPGGPPPSGQQAPYPGQSQYQPYPGASSGPPHGQQGGYSQWQGSYPQQGPQGGYNPGGQQYPSQGQGSYPPQGGYPLGQHQYGNAGPPPPGPEQIEAFKGLMKQTIHEKGLQSFYPPNSPVLDRIARSAVPQVQRLLARWNIPKEVGNDFVKLALYDVVLYIDDSGSMEFETDHGSLGPGGRVRQLKDILARVAIATSHLDEDGIQVRFMNSRVEGNGIHDEQQVEQLVSQVKFAGLTPLGREMQNKVLGPLVLQPARSGQLQKPVLVITITDGEPAGEPKFDIVHVIKSASEELKRTRYGKGAVAFQFAQVGQDLEARDFLSKLDEDPTIGDMIDCTSNYEIESEEMLRANPPFELTPELWTVKLLLGSIDPSYDSKDEKSNGPPGGYGGPPPPQQYGQAQGGYGASSQYGYGGGAPLQQPYGGPGYGPPSPQPGQVWSQQGQYGGPPVSAYSQAPAMQGQYGQPPQGQYGQYGRPPPSPGQGYPPQGGQGYPQPPLPPPRY